MTTRAQRLESLRRTINEYADREEQRLRDEVTFLQSVLNGRSAAGRLSNAVVNRASALTENEVNAFLTE
jgi:hypothetical protein